MRKTMTLGEYLTGRTDDNRSTLFYAYVATLPNGGRITAHHDRDSSTQKYFDQMTNDQSLIAYNMPDGTSRRCEITDNDTTVTLTKGL